MATAEERFGLVRDRLAQSHGFDVRMPYGPMDWTVDIRGGVTLTVNRLTTAGPSAAEVADALAGRAPTAAVLGELPASSRAALSRLADFFNTP